MQVTEVLAESDLKTRPKGFLRIWKGIVGITLVAATAMAIVAASHFYEFGSSDKKFKQALAAVDRGDWNSASRYARELEASQPGSPQSRFVRGAILLGKGFCYPALDELAKAKADEQLETAALTLMGEAWYRLGRYLEAQAALEKVLKYQPDSLEANRWLAATYYDLGIIDKASIHLQKTSELDLTDPRPNRLLGLIHKDFEQYDEAIPFYQESLRRRSDQPDAEDIRQELATCQIKARRYRDALATLASCSDHPAVNVSRAECMHALGRDAQARASLARALKDDPDNLDGLLLQGTIELEDEKPRSAIESLRRAIKAHPKDYTAHFRLAQAYATTGEQELSEAENAAAEKIRVVRHEFSQLHKAAWQRPNDVQVRLRLAALARELDRPDLADVWLRSAAALQPLDDPKSK